VSRERSEFDVVLVTRRPHALNRDRVSCFGAFPFYIFAMAAQRRVANSQTTRRTDWRGQTRSD